MDIVICTVCGNEIPGPFKRRVPEYCSDNCRDYLKFMNAAEKRLGEMRLTAKSVSQLRSELFTLSNQVRTVDQ